jgi:hypothetical protein
LAANVARLCDLEVEYDMTIRVLALLVERLQQLTGSSEVQVSEVLLVDDPPDLSAWRSIQGAICMTAAR